MQHKLVKYRTFRQSTDRRASRTHPSSLYTWGRLVAPRWEVKFRCDLAARHVHKAYADELKTHIQVLQVSHCGITMRICARSKDADRCTGPCGAAVVVCVVDAPQLNFFLSVRDAVARESRATDGPTARGAPYGRWTRLLPRIARPRATVAPCIIYRQVSFDDGGHDGSTGDRVETRGLSASRWFALYGERRAEGVNSWPTLNATPAALNHIALIDI